MRLTDEYHLTCICGNKLISAGPHTICPECQRAVDIQWQAPYTSKPDPPSITDVLEKQEQPKQPERSSK